MTTASIIETDVHIRDAVMKQLDWDPEVDASAVGIAARDGVITLTGYVPDYLGRLAAERAAKQVSGVRGVANDIEVRRTFEQNDSDIARDATRALELRTTVPPTVQLVVRDGHVTLTGKVSWLFQRTGAEAAVRHVRGVLGVQHQIEIAPKAVGRTPSNRRSAAPQCRHRCSPCRRDGGRDRRNAHRARRFVAAARISRARGRKCAGGYHGRGPDSRRAAH